MRADPEQRTVIERRAASRFSTIRRPEIAIGRVRPGRPAQIVDVSAAGALIETGYRLLPGTVVELQLGDPVAVHLVRARVVRCYVARVDAQRIRYRGGLSFQERLPLGQSDTRG